MTARGRDYLKSRFESGDVPPEQDWQDLIDSFLLVTEGFVFAEVVSGATGSEALDIVGPLSHTVERDNVVEAPTALSLT